MIAHRLRSRWTRTLFSLALVALSLMLIGCGEAGHARASAQENAAEAKKAAEPVDIIILIEAWAAAADAKKDHEQELPETIVSQFVDLGESAERTSLRAFELDEAEFVRLAPEERTVLQTTYLFRSRNLRLLAQRTLDAADSLRRKGRLEEARRHIRAVQRCAEMNLSEGIVEIGRMTAEPIRETAEEARDALDGAEPAAAGADQ